MQVGIFGAGSVGCFIAGVLAQQDLRPVMVGREAIQKRVDGGYSISDHAGMHTEIPPDSFRYSVTAYDLGECDLVIVCVKSSDTLAAGRALSIVLKEEATVVSFQNGISNGAVLADQLEPRRVLSAIVGFNVAQIGENRFHRGTEGEILIEADASVGPLVSALAAGGIQCEMRENMEALLWGKLLLNLNNAVNALSGLPLRRQLSQRSYRRVLAAAVGEALAALRTAGIRPARIGRVPPRLIPLILRLPDRLFVRLASAMLHMDEDARSSMAEDLERGRKPEIDWLNGEVIRLAEANNVPAPVNRRLMELVNETAASGARPHYSGERLLKETGLAGGP